MKKLLVVLCAAFLLVGCGGSGESKENDNTVKKTCVYEESGMSVTMEMEGKDDTLTKAAMKINAPYEAIGITKDMLGDEDQQKQYSELMKTELLKVIELDEGDGYDITSDFDDEGYKMSISAEASIFEQTFNASSIEELSKELSDAGYKCE